ncbi:hypothetical protein SH668x_001816 [Planctomicrobium sp. SH668]|uniref:hypothetical protein n=1 Tax=Planctomicrobium sp. SH668 TaxID=3448126 RepID=UPI003F5C5E89
MNRLDPETPFASQSHFAIDDLVPGDSQPGFIGKDCESPHNVERRAYRALMQIQGVRFSSLNVRRCESGIFLTGVAELTGRATVNKTVKSIEAVAAQAGDAGQVVNRLVIQCPTRRYN